MISVITPVFNGEKFINSYANAIKNQVLDHSSFEVVIVDNGSTDGTWVLLKSQFDELVEAGKKADTEGKNIVGDFFKTIDSTKEDIENQITKTKTNDFEP